MERPTGLRPSISGFTLIEMLVVLVVIGILMSLTLPVVVRVRDDARTAPCISNLRQVGMAIRMYMDDHNGGRPIGFQPVYDGGYFGGQGVLLCPEDSTGNWGGNYFEEYRKIQQEDPNKDCPPARQPETIRYSYLHPFRSDWPDWQWNQLLRYAGSRAGIAVCQMHARHTPSTFPASTIDREGLMLRLQLDGAVVKPHIFKTRTRLPSGTHQELYEWWSFWSDTPIPESPPPSAP
jgi:prepilin-type N-terminal cleavage/methylation domain-containing protein